MKWLGFESRWRDALFGAMIPPSGSRPGLANIDQTRFWGTLDQSAPPLVALGLRAAVWILTFMPCFMFKYLKPFNRLSADKKDEFISCATRSNWYLVRQLVMTVKAFSAFAYFSDPGVRKHFGVR